MRRWLLAGALIAAALGVPAAAPPAMAAGTPGTRSIVSVAAGTFSSALGQPGMASSLSVQVAETAVTGDPSWYVTAQVADFSDTATPPDIIPAAALTNSADNTVLVGGGGRIAEGATGALNLPVTLFTDTGESTGTVYNGTYTNTSTLTLTPPDKTFATKTGTTYTSVVTVTLFS